MVMVAMKKPEPKDDLARALRELRQSVDATKTAIDYYGNLSTGIFQSFVKGIAYGLGALVAVAIVIPLVVWALSSVAWPPLIAGFISQIIAHIHTSY